MVNEGGTLHRRVLDAAEADAESATAGRTASESGTRHRRVLDAAEADAAGAVNLAIGLLDVAARARPVAQRRPTPGTGLRGVGRRGQPRVATAGGGPRAGGRAAGPSPGLTRSLPDPDQVLATWPDPSLPPPRPAPPAAPDLVGGAFSQIGSIGATCADFARPPNLPVVAVTRAQHVKRRPWRSRLMILTAAIVVVAAAGGTALALVLSNNNSSGKAQRPPAGRRRSHRLADDHARLVHDAAT